MAGHACHFAFLYHHSTPGLAYFRSTGGWEEAAEETRIARRGAMRADVCRRAARGI